MAEALTYNQLLSDVETYLERSDAPFLQWVPRFVMYAENRLASEVRSLGFQQAVTGTLSGATLAKPARWRETSSFSITVGSERVFLQPRGYDYCRAFAPDQALTGQPRYYSDYNYEHFLIAPTPALQSAFELIYFERPEPLDTTNQTNFTTQYAPQLLLYASLLEAQPFLKRPERIQEFQAMYDRALQAFTAESQRRVAGDRTTGARTKE